jgi:hypothetical protein
MVESPEQATQGLEPIIGDPSTFKIGETLYRFRRFTMKDTFAIATLVKQIWHYGTIDVDLRLKSIDPSDGLKAILAIPFAIPDMEGEIFKWLASVLRQVEPDGSLKTLTIEDIGDLPLGSEPTLLDQLSKHPDFKSFLASKDLMVKNPWVQKMLQFVQKPTQENSPASGNGESTEFSPDTLG